MVGTFTDTFSDFDAIGKLDGDGEPQWLTVIEVMSDVSDVVRSASSRPPNASFYAAHP